MAEPAAATEYVGKPPQRAPWDQQPGENDLWYSRFLRFVALGPVGPGHTGRSLSLLTKGRRNAYPVPAHWPQQASQHEWHARAKAFDQWAREDYNAAHAAFATLLVVVRDRLNASGLTDARDAMMGVDYARPVQDEDDREPES